MKYIPLSMEYNQEQFLNKQQEITYRLAGWAIRFNFLVDSLNIEGRVEGFKFKKNLCHVHIFWDLRIN